MIQNSKVFKTSQKYHGRILWHATLQQNSTIAEFYGKISQQRYNKTVPQQNSVVVCNYIETEQYHEQNAMVEYYINTIAECCGRIPQYHSRVQWHYIKMRWQNITTTP